jgi:ubiquinone/menaquinone biosynthesis C-methylase UbiE
VRRFSFEKKLSNEAVYHSKSVLEFYTEYSGLNKPELTIFNILKSKLPNMSMLDIGVGGGRTTEYFGLTAKRYIGVDYSNDMISICEKKFHDHLSKISFQVADARRLPFSNNSFDFVLFSFNGLDYVGAKDRIKILYEINRVTKNSGYFCFSSHNLNSASRYFSFHRSLNPIKIFNEIKRIMSIRFYNRDKWKTLRNADLKAPIMFNDGAQKFFLNTYYITPSNQIMQLEESGFSNIQVFGLSDGKEVTCPNHLFGITDFYLYYLCNKR